MPKFFWILLLCILIPFSYLTFFDTSVPVSNEEMKKSKSEQELITENIEAQQKRREDFKIKAGSKCRYKARGSARHAGKYKLRGSNTVVIGDIATVRGNAEFMNGFGAYIPKRYRCKYELQEDDTLELLDFSIY